MTGQYPGQHCSDKEWEPDPHCPKHTGKFKAPNAAARKAGLADTGNPCVCDLAGDRRHRQSPLGALLNLLGHYNTCTDPQVE